ncbi:MAG TPA: peptide chain release factor 2 [Longimicrobiales bacterium]|nr:peptide chain release factor 2 [Longimicrobiales bacterium]
MAIPDVSLPDSPGFGRVQSGVSFFCEEKWQTIVTGSSPSSAKSWTRYGGTFDLDRKQEALKQLETRMAAAGFWDDSGAAREVIGQANELKAWVEPWTELTAKAAELQELGELIAADTDEALEGEWLGEVVRLAAEVEKLELRAMLRGADDARDALLTIHPGAGGTESQDWAEMLMRMYSRWAESHGYAVDLLDHQPGDEAGIKSVTLEIKGRYAYGYLKAEKGVHRLVRISPFDAQSRRHTSFASVFVYPVVDNDIDIQIDDKDLRIDTFRASGAGGQHVNKTSSAIRITHLPTNIVVQCQNERSQFQNKATALKMLKAALYQRELELREAERQKLESQKTDISWGNQIRSYVFQPYTMVTDHRTELKVGDVQRVMNGDLDEFIEAYLKEFGARVA